MLKASIPAASILTSFILTAFTVIFQKIYDLGKALEKIRDHGKDNLVRS